MSLILAKNATVEFRALGKEKQPLGKWLTTKTGVPYMNICRFAPNRHSGGANYRIKPAWVVQAFANSSNVAFTISHVYDGKATAVKKYILSFRNRKDGSRAFYFKELTARYYNGRVTWRVRHSTPYRFLSELLNIIRLIRRPQKISSAQVPCAQAARIKLVVNSFILKHHPNGKKFLRYCPKSPFDTMFLCVYPGYEMFAGASLDCLPMSKDAKDDSKKFVKRLLKTNGNTTRRLLIAAAKDRLSYFPNFKTLFFALKNVSRIYGLDNATKLITPNSTAWYKKSGFNFFESGGDLLKSKLVSVKQFKHYTYRHFLELFGINTEARETDMELVTLCRDTGRMIVRLGGIPMDIEHKSLKELHDALVERLPVEPLLFGFPKREPRFACFLASGSLAKEIERLNPEWEVVFPSSEVEFREWSKTMRHCISCYAISIWDRACDCVAIVRKSDEKMLYNLELQPSERGKISVVQFRGKYNCDPTKQDLKVVEHACENLGMDIYGVNAAD
jgi:hypothetical protein